jgi:hypothetical protein
MKPVFSDADITRVNWFQQRLEEEGIPTFVRNQHLHNLATWMPVPAFHPTLCVLDDDDEQKALDLLEEFQSETLADAALPSWICEGCGAEVPGNFTECWQCQRAKAV